MARVPRVPASHVNAPRESRPRWLFVARVPGHDGRPHVPRQHPRHPPQHARHLRTVRHTVHCELRLKLIMKSKYISKISKYLSDQRRPFSYPFPC